MAVIFVPGGREATRIGGTVQSGAWGVGHQLGSGVGVGDVLRGASVLRGGSVRRRGAGNIGCRIVNAGFGETFGVGYRRRHCVGSDVGPGVGECRVGLGNRRRGVGGSVDRGSGMGVGVRRGGRLR